MPAVCRHAGDHDLLRTRVRATAELARRGLGEGGLHQDEVIGIEHHALGPLAHLDLKLV